jgi:shikimate dehydrogenase
MLVAQAVLAAEYFTENHFSTDVIEDIYNQLKNKKENIVLIGMPASGKTTIGKILSEKTGKKFIDTDELIINKTGKQITDIFNEVGEVGFRKIEREVIKEISTETSSVIATGGGAILDFDNLISLMHNGKIVFLDRPLSELLPTFDRPLANSKEQVIKRYNERIDLYNSASELTVNVTNPEETAKKILNSI